MSLVNTAAQILARSLLVLMGLWVVDVGFLEGGVPVAALGVVLVWGVSWGLGVGLSWVGHGV